jgi:DNA polymerase III subunit delta'
MAGDDQELDAWDRIEGIPDPLENLRLVGHRNVLDQLAERYASGRMHHAWLLTGPRGIGKATLAARFAGHLFRHPDPANAPRHYVDPQDDDPVEGQVARGAHPNYLHMRRPWNEKDKKWRRDLTVEEIRRTVPFFGKSAARPGWRVAVVDTADDLNASAANALLKILEEPPPNALFLVLANAPSMLATIRSRCQKIIMRPPSKADIIDVLGNLGFAQDLSAGDLALVAELSGGSVRRAITLANGRGIELYRRYLSITSQIDTVPWDLVHALAGELAPAEANDRYRLLLDIVQDTLSRRLRGEVPPEAADSHAGGHQPHDLARLADVWEKINRSAQLADAWNLDRKQVILNLFLSLHEAR